jgi:predicted HTH transcriptional regulator
VPIRGKLISEISPADIYELMLQATPEDQFLEFKAELLDPRKPAERLDADRADWVSDLVAFANAQGGHIIVGLQADDQERASRLRPMTGDDAKKLAGTLRDVAIAHIKPNIIQLEVRSYEITSAEWIVIAGIPRSSDKPHMSSMHHGTRFTVRDGDRKREMAYDEIQRLYLDGPQQQLQKQLASQIEEIKSQVESIHARLAGLEQELRKAG